MLAAISYDPIVRVELGPLSISPHGVGIAAGFLIGAWLMLPTSRRKGIPDDKVYPLFTLAAVGAVIGARVAYVINHLSEYDSIIEPFEIWHGGISLVGGFFGAVLMAMPRIRRERLSFWKVMDSAAPGMALGVVVGRIGDLVVGDHLGKTTDFFLGYRCPPLSVETASPCAPTEAATRTVGAVVHQTALYDQLFALIILLVLLWLRRKPRFDGFLILVFAFSYGIARLIEDFLRDDVRRFGLTGSQWTALVTVLVCSYALFMLRRTPRWGRWDEAPAGKRPPAEPPAGAVAGHPDSADHSEPAGHLDPADRRPDT